jgi:23S rRNA pseudouridine2605 synthase
VKHGKRNQRSDVPASKVGLARAISKLGYCSRSKAGALIRAGRVKLNGARVKNPESPVRMGVDRIELEGRRIEAAKKIYLMVNKPRGLVTTAEDEHGRDTVYSLLPQDVPWIAPVGRLDKASEGLIVFTNDSAWAARITAPETHLDKTYHVQIGVVADDALLRALEKGAPTGSGEVLRAKQARMLRSGEKISWLEIVLDEGKNRQIRRMLDALGIGVLRLVRVAIGPLVLGDLPRGKCRPLAVEEKIALDRAMGSVTARTTDREAG